MKKLMLSALFLGLSANVFGMEDEQAQRSTSIKNLNFTFDNVIMRDQKRFTKCMLNPFEIVVLKKEGFAQFKNVLSKVTANSVQFGNLKDFGWKVNPIADNSPEATHNAKAGTLENTTKTKWGCIQHKLTLPYSTDSMIYEEVVKFKGEEAKRSSSLTAKGYTIGLGVLATIGGLAYAAYNAGFNPFKRS